MTATAHRKTLPNGLRVVAVEMPHLHSTEIAVYVRVGGRDDSRATAGLAHFLEHMLFRGTAEHPTNLELEAAFEAIGGCVNAATDAESTSYYSRVHPDHVTEGLRLLAAMVLTPTFPGIDIEKRIITEEALEDINDHGDDINPDNLSSSMLWPDHPLGMPTIGYLDTISAITEADLKGHMTRYYVPTNAVVVAAGRVRADDVFGAVADAFGTWAGPSAPGRLPPPSNQDEPRCLFVKDADSQVDLQITFRGFSRPDPQLAASRLLRRVLAGGGCSRLHLNLRERLGIVYSVDAQVAAYDETGCFSIELSTAPENLLTAVEEVLGETRKLAAEPVGAEELRRVRQGYFFDLAYSEDSTFEMQVRYGWGELMGMVKGIDEERAEVEAVDEGTLQAVARRLFAPAALNLVAVGPVTATAKRRIEQLLRRYAKEFPTSSQPPGP
ncbi:insulinase family protein [Geobacter sulfurreducens]|uniref:M16 family metallopeptidase n=1 Tax=Geobacter sulfurreducens TaxID=35554 RepID=UPI001BDD19AD|nr:pitrilysin family protein [Geobacter sulfurreducens]QVW35141.1 insulinase family protein [Geobacter sulfurreducens]